MESMHGACSPRVQHAVISRQENIDNKKELAKAVAKVSD